MTRITDDRPSRRKSRSGLMWGVLFILVLLLAFTAWSYRALNQAKSPLILMSRGFAASLAQADISTAAGQYMDPATPLADRLRNLKDLRASLAKQGLVWAGAKPLGFGGSLATVTDPAIPKGAIPAAVSYIYFQSSKGVFAVEVSARQSGSRFLVTRIWKGERVTGSPEAHSQKAYEAFAKEEPHEALAKRIENPRYLFVRFPSS